MGIQPVTLEHWPTMQIPQSEVKATLQYLAHKTQKPVSFRSYSQDEGYSDHSVSVRVFVKDGLAATYNPSQVTIGGQVHSLASEQRGMASALVRDEWKKIIDDEDQLIGCVDHNRIVLPIEVTASDNDAARAVLAFVVEQSIPLLDFDLGEIMKEKQDEFTRNFVAAFQQSIKTRLRSRQEEFDQREREAEQAYYTVLDFERDRPVLQEELKHLTSLAEKPHPQQAKAQAKALLEVQASGLYSHISLNDGGVLRATTAPITIEHDGYEFPLGRYMVEIPANGDIRMKALDEHPNAEHPHPHVAHDGRPCLGNISADLAKLIGKMRYAEALQLVSQFLASYNPENPYERLGHFDPSGSYQDEDDDPCEDCDEKCTPYCIFSCDHNTDIYSCEDCCEHRSQYCYEECDHNVDFERFHPCDNCEAKGDEHCYLKCRYNQEWQLQNPCDGCEDKCSESCPYHERKEALENAKA